jgi:hypothetical protein
MEKAKSTVSDREGSRSAPVVRERDVATYRPEPVYFYASPFGPRAVFSKPHPDFPREHAARVTARTVARWATRYQAWPVADPAQRRESRLPRAAAARSALIDAAFAEIEQVLAGHAWPWEWVGLWLYRGERILLDQHDGVPAKLFLTAAQFARLQEALDQAGLPRDLYYPAWEVRIVVEPYRVPFSNGSIVVGERAYSPRQWAQREANPVEVVPVPSEAERRLAVVRACSDLLGALDQGRTEFREPRRENEAEEVAAIDSLAERVGKTAELITRIQRRHIQRPPDRSAPEASSDQPDRGGTG